MARGEQWQDRAACRGMDVELFYGTNTTAAKRICRRCPVTQQCFDYAMAVETAQRCYGIWGGMTADEREAIRRDRRRTCPQCGGDYLARNSDQVYCCQRCAALARHARRRQETAA